MKLRSVTTTLLTLFVMLFASPDASAGEGADKARSFIPEIDLGGYFFGGNWLSDEHPGLDSGSNQDELADILLKQCLAFILCLGVLVLGFSWPKLRAARALATRRTGPSGRYRR